MCAKYFASIERRIKSNLQRSCDMGIITAFNTQGDWGKAKLDTQGYS